MRPAVLCFLRLHRRHLAELAFATDANHALTLQLDNGDTFHLNGTGTMQATGSGTDAAGHVFADYALYAGTDQTQPSTGNLHVVWGAG